MIIGLSTSPVVGEQASSHFGVWHYGAFTTFVVVLLLLDLFVLNRKHKVPGPRKALLQSLLLIALGLMVPVVLVVFTDFGVDSATQYFAGYFTEYSLSIDNVFVFSLIFACFAIPRQYQHTVLFWGIFGALVMRFTFISVGISALETWSGTVLVFGFFLLYSGYKLRGGDEQPDVYKMLGYRLFTWMVPTTRQTHGALFFTRQEGGIKATPLFVCLLVVEVADLVFATDSVPAILAISQDPFVVFSSNAMAIVGLRSLYFLFDAVKDKFTRLNSGLAVILAGVGLKMIVSSDVSVFGWFSMPGVPIPAWISLMFIVVVLVTSVVASVKWPRNEAIPS